MSSYHERAWDSKWRLENRPKREYIQYLHFDKGMSIDEIANEYKWLLTPTEVMAMCDYFKPEKNETTPPKNPRKGKLQKPKSKNKLSWAIYNAGYLQVNFAMKVGINPNTLSKRIARKVPLTEQEAEWYSDVLNVDKDWLLEGGDYDGRIPEKQRS